MSDVPESKDELHRLLQGGRWQSVLKFFDDSVHKDNLSLLPFKAQALLRLEINEEAFSILRELIKSNPQSTWIINLYCEALGRIKNDEYSVTNFLKGHIVENDINSEGVLTRCADLLRTQSRFTEAVSINARRKVIKATSKKIALAIQTFNKKDTLEHLFDSLLMCDDTKYFSPVILQDSWKGSKREAEFKQESAEVKKVIHKYLPELIDKFGNIEVIENQENMGTAPSCVKLLNHVTERYTSFVFFEDDCILYKDTLTWSKFALNNLINEYGPHFSSCESVFFDYGRNAAPSDIQLEKLKKIAAKLVDKYCHLKFIPSTNFMTTSRLWKRYSSLRCLPRGPESLNQYYSTIGGVCVFPIVARTSDIGMEHELGFSTTALGKGNVKEIKNSYINSGMYKSEKLYSENVEHQDLIYSATSNLVEEHINKLVELNFI